MVKLNVEAKDESKEIQAMLDRINTEYDCVFVFGLKQIEEGRIRLEDAVIGETTLTNMAQMVSLMTQTQDKILDYIKEEILKIEEKEPAKAAYLNFKIVEALTAKPEMQTTYQNINKVPKKNTQNQKCPNCFTAMLGTLDYKLKCPNCDLTVERV